MAKTVAATSKPELIDNLRATWRKSTEHKVAQVKLFLSSLIGIVLLQVVSDTAAGKVPFSTVHDVRSLWFYLVPLGLVAWRQLHPALTASQVDSAPGVTIVPEQVLPDAPVAPTDPATGAGADPASGYAGLGLVLVVVGVILAIIGGIWVLVGAAAHVLDVGGLILLAAGLVLWYFGSGAGRRGPL